jgi:hypothetical protein
MVCISKDLIQILVGNLANPTEAFKFSSVTPRKFSLKFTLEILTQSL